RPEWKPTSARWGNDKLMAECKLIDLDQPFSRSTGDDADKWGLQMSKIASCVEADGDNKNVADLLRWGSKVEASKPVAPNKSIFGLLVEILGGFIPSKGEPSWLTKLWREISDLLVDDSTFNDMKLMNKLLPL